MFDMLRKKNWKEVDREGKIGSGVWPKERLFVNYFNISLLELIVSLV